MKAIEIASFGAPEVLREVDRPAAPIAGHAGEALIRVAASGVNRPDVLAAQGPLPGAAWCVRPAGAGDGGRP